jgi:hypothetical protein
MRCAAKSALSDPGSIFTRSFAPLPSLLAWALTDSSHPPPASPFQAPSPPRQALVSPRRLVLSPLALMGSPRQANACYRRAERSPGEFVHSPDGRNTPLFEAVRGPRTADRSLAQAKGATGEAKWAESARQGQRDRLLCAEAVGWRRSVEARLLGSFPVRAPGEAAATHVRSGWPGGSPGEGPNRVCGRRWLSGRARSSP